MEPRGYLKKMACAPHSQDLLILCKEREVFALFILQIILAIQLSPPTMQESDPASTSSEDEVEYHAELPLWGAHGCVDEQSIFECVDKDQANSNNESSVVETPARRLSHAEKRALKEQRRIAFWKNKRANRKTKQRLLKQERQKAPTEEKQVRVRLEETEEEKAARREARRQRKKEEKLLKLHWPRIVIDLSFESVHSEKEIRSVAQQIQNSFGCLRKSKRPLEVHLTSVTGRTEDALKRHAGYPKWQMEKHSETYLEVFADQRSQLVYLSPDSPNVLDNIDPEKIYIIGGIADPNIIRGLTYSKASQQDIPTAQLPLSLYSNLTRKVLNINHVVGIIVDVAETGDWYSAIAAHTPTRKAFYQNPEHNRQNKEKETEKDGEGQ
jgi:tRNA (guanine9-N1)-methyltransferase